MKNLTTGHPLKLIFFFALPLMFGNLFTTTLYHGRYHDCRTFCRC